MKHCALMLFLLLTACSTLPPAITQAPSYDLSYFEASQNLDKYKNAPVRWGGVVVDVANEQNRSLIQILSYPLNGQGRPLTDQPHQGRFVISSPEFLDPAVYEKDSPITVAGVLVGGIERTVDKKTLHLPLLTVTAMHLWPTDYYANSPVYGGYGTFNSYYGYQGWGFYRPIFFPPPR
ncbi:MAG: Slp family lipoprotein [Methylovulum sp.]|nr:Slp family lipoprotein [Methylovulum sp.]